MDRRRRTRRHFCAIHLSLSSALFRSPPQTGHLGGGGGYGSIDTRTTALLSSFGSVPKDFERFEKCPACCQCCRFRLSNGIQRLLIWIHVSQSAPLGCNPSPLSSRRCKMITLRATSLSVGSAQDKTNGLYFEIPLLFFFDLIQRIRIGLGQRNAAPLQFNAEEAKLKLHCRSC